MTAAAPEPGEGQRGDDTPEPSERRRTLSRRGLLAAGFGVIGTALVLDTTLRATRPTPERRMSARHLLPRLSGQGYLLRAERQDSAAVLLCTEDGTPVQRFRGYRFGETSFGAGRVSVGTARDGSDALVATYEPPDGQSARVRGYFIPRGPAIEVVFDFVGLDGLAPNDGMLLRENYSQRHVVETVHGVADWDRDPRGGLPFQRAGRYVYLQEHAGRTLAIVTRGGSTDWRGNRSVHLPPVAVSDDLHRATAHLVLGAESRPPFIDAVAGREPLAVMLDGDAPYNIWQGGDDTPVLRAAAYNGRAARELTLSWVAHDFDGTTIAEGGRTMPAGERSTVEAEVAVPLAGRGIAFVELTVTAGDDERYDRTNVAVLPPHSFDDGPEESMFGISANYVFGGDDELALLRRIGVRRSRHTHFSAEELKRYGLSQHRLRTPPSPSAFSDDPAALAEYVSAELDRAQATHSRYYELANEWNTVGRGRLSGDGSAAYVHKWVRAFHDEIRRRDSDIKLIPVGLAGMDVPYADGMFDAGLDRYVDAFNLHPGRANFTADFDPAQGWQKGGHGFWNYLGAIRQARRLIDERADGKLELWLTEVYAPTRPNRWWDDSYRHAAENVVLSAALALSVGATAMQWYQLYDNVAADPYGAAPSDPQYHHGLLLRDLSPKPSLLAYAAAAEHLDGARFRRFRGLDDPDLRGMELWTPRGRLALLWSRADGHVLNKSPERDGSFYPEPEPWQDTWQTRTQVTVAATRDRVTEIDVIGRERVIDAQDGRVRITLDGAVRMYYGLDVSSVRTADR